MEERYKQHLALFRQHLPIGMQHGLLLLEKTNGDLSRAEAIFRQEMLDLVVTKTNVATEVAVRHLLACQFDIPATLLAIDEERFTLTERALRSRKQPEDALMTVSLLLERAYELPRDFWLPLDQLPSLPTAVHTFLVATTWLNYEEYEGFDYAIHFYPNIVIEQFEQALQLPQLASLIRETHSIFASRTKLGRRSVRTELLVVQFQEAYNNLRPALITQLHKLVGDHLDQFP